MGVDVEVISPGDGNYLQQIINKHYCYSFSLQFTPLFFPFFRSIIQLNYFFTMLEKFQVGLTR